MHILLVSRSFPHHRPGGLEWHSQDLVEGLIEAGHRVSVLTTPLPRRPALKKLSVNGRVYTFGRTPGRYDSRFGWQMITRLRRSLRDIQPDVIHAQGFSGVPFYYLGSGDAPLLTTIHGTLWSETLLPADDHLPPGLAPSRWRLYWQYRHRLAFSHLWKRFVRESRWLAVDSRYSREALQRETGRPRRPPIVVPLGFDLRRYPEKDRHASRDHLELPHDAIVLLALGRLEPVKGPGIILESVLQVARDNPRLHLVMAGTGSMLGELRSIARAHPCSDQVRFPGHVSADDVPAYYAAADLFLNADLGNPAFGLTNAEALSFGTPVMATPSGAHPEVIRSDDDGWLVPGSAGAWEPVLRRILSELPEAEETRATRAARARERFARTRMIQRLEAVYQRMLQDRRR